MDTFFERRHAVERHARLAAEHKSIAMSQGNFLRFLLARYATE